MTAKLRELEALAANPREALEIEVKGWLDLTDNEHKACLAKALLALANHGGGYVLIGFEEGRAGPVFSGANPHGMDGYSQDEINGIVQRYADPAFHCEVYDVGVGDAGVCCVVVVPGGHEVPIRARRGGPNGRHVAESSYYVRLPGPESALPRTGKDWDSLIRRCLKNARAELLDDFRRILAGSSESNPAAAKDAGLGEWVTDSQAVLAARIEESGRPSPYALGGYNFAYVIEEVSTVQGLADFRATLSSFGGWTGWRPWWVPDTNPDILPKVRDGNIECWFAGERDPAHSDFWRGNPKGRMFLARGFQEDSVAEKVEPGKKFSVTLPIWRVGEALNHADQLAASIGEPGTRVHFWAKWSGLARRSLAAWPDNNFNWDLWDETHKCHDASVESRLVVTGSEIAARLPELVAAVVRPVFESFGFYAVPDSAVEHEVKRLRKGTR